MVFVILDNPTNKDSVLDIRVPIFRPGKPPEIKSYMEQFPFPFYIILRDINALPLTLSDALRQWFELVSCLEWSCTKRLLHDSWCPGDWERKRGAFCDIVEVPVARFISSPYGKAELLIIMEFISIWFLSTEVYTDLSVALWLQIITFDSGIWPILGGLENAIQPHEMLDIVITKNFMIHSDRRITSWHSDGPFRVAPRLCFKSEAKCNAIAMKRICYSHEKETHFYEKGFALSHVSKVRVFATQKWPTPSAEGLTILVQRTTRIKIIVNSILNIL